METIGYAASFIMGIVLGLMGGGGSILTVPILVYLFGLAPTVATAYSLFVVGVTALVGSALAVRQGDVDFRIGLAFAVPSVIGIHVARGVLLPRTPEVIAALPGFTLTKETLIMTAFAALMLAASLAMIRPGRAAAPGAGRAFSLGVKGLLVGLIAGFVGAGGGFLIIPALVLFAGLSMRVAVGTSLTIIALQSLLGFAGDLARGADVDWGLLTLVAAAAVAGIGAGAALGPRIGERRLRTAFGWFVLMMGAVILFEQLFHLSLNSGGLS